MHIAFALSVLADALDHVAERVLTEYRPQGRRMMELAGMVRYWEKKAFLVQPSSAVSAGVEIEKVRIDMLKEQYDHVIFTMTEAVLAAVENVDEYAEMRRAINKVDEIAYYFLRDGKTCEGFVCANCGAPHDEKPDRCGVCGGGGNQVVRTWEL